MLLYEDNRLYDSLMFVDISILNNLHPTFDKKIALEIDTLAKLAMSYLSNAE